MPVSSSAADTPTRATQAARPHTRAWKQLIDDATNKTSAAANQRARLRAHLAAADRLAAKRAALTAKRPPKPSAGSKKSIETKALTVVDDSIQPEVVPSVSEKLSECENTPSVLVPSSQDSVQPLFDLSAEWTDRVSAFAKFVQTPSAELAPSVALVLPSCLRDLRSKVVAAASDAAVALAPFLKPDERKSIFTAASAGTSVTKKVVADSSRRAALAVLSDCVEPCVWEHVISTLGNDHVTSRELVVSAATQLVDTAPSTAFPFVSSVVMDVLRPAAVDKHLQVRDGCRDLVSHFRVRLGDEKAQSLLKGLPADVRSRLVAALPAPASDVKKGSVEKINLSKRKATTNIRDMIKARRDALKKCRPNDNVINNVEVQAPCKDFQSSEKSGESLIIPVGEENTKPNLDLPLQ